MTKPPIRPARPASSLIAVSRRRGLLALLCALLACAAAGCGNLIPGASPVTTYTSQATANSDNGVRVWPPEPTKGEDPKSIISGFLLSSASGPADTDIADAYLTGAAKSAWNVGDIYIYTGKFGISDGVGPDEYVLNLQVIATLGSGGQYTPTAAATPSSLNFTFKLAKTADGFRIAQLPADFGMAMDEEQFRSGYAPYSVYFGTQITAAQPGMIPVQYYVPSGDTDQATADQLADDLVAGPPTWISGVSVVAASAQSDSQPQVSIDQNGVAQVVLAAPADCADNACVRLADELRVSFAGIGSVTGVQVKNKQGTVLGTADTLAKIESVYGVKPPGQAGRGSTGGPTVYYLDGSGRAQRDPLQGGSSSPGPGEVPIAPSGVKLGQLAAAADAGAPAQIAAVNTAQTELYVTQAGASAAGAPVFTGTAISSLTWDGYGDLWFTATVGGAPAVYRLAAQQTAPQQVDVDSVLDGPIQQLAVAPDGRRVAVLYGTGPGGLATSLALGTAETFAGGTEWSLDLDLALQRLVSGWNGIADVTWTDGRSFAVLGTQTASSAPTIYQYYSDGSPVVDTDLSSAMTVIPPGGTSAISWTDGSASVLLAQCSSCTDGQPEQTASPGTQGGGGQQGPSTGQQQFIEQYEPAGGSWTELVSGTSPSIVS